MKELAVTVSPQVLFFYKESGFPVKCLAEVLRCIPLFPFNITAHTGLLLCNRFLTLKYSIEGLSQVQTGYRDVVAGPAIIHLAPID